jgi:Glycosyl hydrolase family 92.
MWILRRRFNRPCIQSLLETKLQLPDINTRNGELIVEGNSVSGFQYVDQKTRIYIYAETNRFPEKTGTLIADSLTFGQTKAVGRNAALVLAYGEKEQNIGLRYGISFISTEQAKKNLQREITAYDVDVVAKAGRNEWNKSLSKSKCPAEQTMKKRFFIRLCIVPMNE